MRNLGSSFGRKASMIAAAVALGAGVLGAASDAQAAFMLRLSSSAGGLPVVITDNDFLAGDLDPNPDSIITNKTVLGYSVSITAGIENVPGSPTGATLQITNIAKRANDALGAPTLTIQISATNYSDPSGGGLTLESSGAGTFTNSTSGLNTLTFNSYADASNAIWGMGTPAPTQSYSIVGAGGTDGTTFPDTSAPFAGTLPIYGK
jgi:hypothetical protein